MMFDLVTGGAGFIGSHIVDALLQQGRKVRVVDNLSTGRASNLEHAFARYPSQIDFIEEALESPGCAAKATQNVERVFHLAARPSVPWSFKEPKAAFQANHGTTLALIEAAKESDVQRIVFSSSAAVYGDLPGLPKTESDRLKPQSPYADHKLAGEVALADFATHKSAVCLRYFNVFGPRQDPSSPYSGVISLFADWLSQGKEATVFGDGTQTRDFVFVGDVVQANLAAADLNQTLPDASAQSYAICNIAGGKSISILELWEQLCLASGVTPSAPEHLPAREGDIKHSLASIEQAKEILNWVPEMPFQEGLKLTLEMAP